MTGSADNPLRVLMVEGRLDPAPGAICTLTLTRVLAARGHSVTLAHGGGLLEGNFGKHPPFSPLKVQLLGNRLFDFFTLRRLVQALGSRKPDLVHLHDMSLDVCAQWLARRMNVPCVMTVHAFDAEQTTLHIGKNTRFLVAGVQAIRESLINRAGVPRDLVKVLPLGVDTVHFKDEGPFKNHQMAPVVGTIVPLEDTMDLTGFVEAAGLVLQRHLEVQFLIAGKGPREDALRRQVAETGVEKQFTFIDHFRDPMEVLSILDVFVMPSLNAGQILTLLAAMSCARPVAVCAGAEVYDLVKDRATGFHVPPRNPEALAATVCEFLEDRSRARSIGMEGRKFVIENHSAECMADAVEDLYRESVQ